jgi:uridine phosphorylase
MPDIIIHPTREANEPQLPAAGLLFINPGDMAKAERLLRKRQAVRHFLYNSNLFVVPESGNNNSFFAAGPAIGAPMAVLTLEKLLALGAEQIIVYGSCGSLDPSLKIGDILLPTWGISEEGTSHHYPVDQKPQSDRALRSALHTAFANKELFVTEGPAWTTDAPYRENRTTVKEYADRGVLAVDMEFTALCTVATFRQARIAFAMLVSDELHHERWQSGFGSKTFRRTNAALIETLMDISPL